MKEAAVAALVSCYSELPCGGSDDSCGVSAAKAGDPDFPYTRAYQACLTRQRECKGAFADDYCLFIPVLEDGTRKAFEACINEPCNEVRACFKRVLAN